MVMTTAEKPRSRSKLTKALVATGVGVALLAGGGGTFAAWTSEATVKPGAVSSGQLTLGAPSGGTWSSESTGDIKDIATYRIVPGETLTFTQDVTVTAAGKALSYNLGTNLANPTVVTSNELASVLIQNATFTVDGDPVSGPLDAAVGTRTVEVTATIDFPFGSTNATQLKTVNLKNVVLTATQVGPNAV